METEVEILGSGAEGLDECADQGKRIHYFQLSKVLCKPNFCKSNHVLNTLTEFT